jgi:hypothetical protein
MKNIYEQFIEHLKKTEKKLNVKDKNLHLEKHPILPVHDGGKQKGSIVLCTSKNHTLAHDYRYLVYKQTGDLVAFTMRKNQKIGVYESVLLSIEKKKQRKNTFWSSDWQSEQGKKGGKRSGQKNALLYYIAKVIL